MAVVLWAAFRRSQQRHGKQAISLQKELHRKVDVHHWQIQTRQARLDRYHFLKYNLSEALQPQPEIKI